MPELPEVETIRRDLVSRILDVPISEVEVRLQKTTRGKTEELQRLLRNNRIHQIERTGKLLIGHIEGQPNLILIHLKMTGQLIYQHGADHAEGGHPFPAFTTTVPNQYTHLILHFSNGGKLFFNDLRQFGYFTVGTPQEVDHVRTQYGIEPLTPEFTEEALTRRLAKRQAPLKTVLLDQKTIAGLGNIYVDETCWQAEIHPSRAAASLTPQECSKLYEAIQHVIAQAIKHRGTSFHDYRDGEGKKGGYAPFLVVYGRAGKPCPRCNTPIQKIKLAGRGTHFCPNCQRSNLSR